MRAEGQSYRSDEPRLSGRSPDNPTDQAENGQRREQRQRKIRPAWLCFSAFRPRKHSQTLRGYAPGR